MYLDLTFTNSCLCFSNFICDKECNIKQSESRKIIFEILKHCRKTRCFRKILETI